MYTQYQSYNTSKGSTLRPSQYILYGREVYKRFEEVQTIDISQHEGWDDKQHKGLNKNMNYPENIDRVTQLSLPNQHKNICFMNALLNVLASVPPIVTWVRYWKEKKKTYPCAHKHVPQDSQPPHCVVKHFVDVIYYLSSDTSSSTKPNSQRLRELQNNINTSADALRDTLRDDGIGGPKKERMNVSDKQEDAHELLVLLINEISYQTFTWILKTKKIQSGWARTKLLSKWEEIANTSSWIRMFTSFDTENTILPNIIRYKNINTTNIANGLISKGFSIRMGNIASIYYVLYSRFADDGKKESDWTAECKQNFEIKYFTSEGIELKVKYMLAGIVLHTGKSLGSGHYTAIVKVMSDYYFADDNKHMTEIRNINNLSKKYKKEIYLAIYYRIKV